MKRLLAAVAFIIAAVLLSGHAALFAQNLQTATKPPWERGDAYLYGRFFAQVMQMNQQADEADRLGMNSTYLRTYFQVKAQLNSSETILLNQITAKLAAKLVQYDANAEKLRRDRHLAAQTARANNQPIPPLPAAIKQIPAGRDALILAARNQLRLNFGDAEFARLNAYLRTHAPWKQPDPTAPPRPAAANKALPDRVYYRSLFHSVTHFKAKAQEERDMGLTQLADGLLTLVQRKAGLSDEQARILDQVTVDYQQAASDYEKRLQAAGLVYRKLAMDMLARDGKITPTPELISAQRAMDVVRKQLDDLADDAIQRLHAAFGEQEFAGFDVFVKRPVKGTPAGAEVTQ